MLSLPSELSRPAERLLRREHVLRSWAVDRVEKWSVGSFKVKHLLLDSFSLSAYLAWSLRVEAKN